LPEGIGQIKIPITTSGIEPATFPREILITVIPTLFKIAVSNLDVV
jgi:hypothetical protein